MAMATETVPPPASSVLGRDVLWQELVRARAELLGWEFDAARANAREDRGEDNELRKILENIQSRVERLSGMIIGSVDWGDDDENAPSPRSDEDDAGSKRQRRAGHAGRPGVPPQKEANLEKVRAQIAVLEESIGDGQSADDPHVVRELERLRGLAFELEEDLQRQEKLQEQRQEQAEQVEARQGQRRLAALVRRRDSAAGSLQGAELRLEKLRETLRSLQPEDDAQQQSIPARRQARIARLQEHIAEKDGELEQLRQQVSAAEIEIAELNGGEPIEVALQPRAEARLEDLRRRMHEREGTQNG
jgi:hypothetical protein